MPISMDDYGNLTSSDLTSKLKVFDEIGGASKPYSSAGTYVSGTSGASSSGMGAVGGINLASSIVSTAGSMAVSIIGYQTQKLVLDFQSRSIDRDLNTNNKIFDLQSKTIALCKDMSLEKLDAQKKEAKAQADLDVEKKRAAEIKKTIRSQKITNQKAQNFLLRYKEQVALSRSPHFYGKGTLT